MHSQRAKAFSGKKKKEQLQLKKKKRLQPARDSVEEDNVSSVQKTVKSGTRPGKIKYHAGNCCTFKRLTRRSLKSDWDVAGAAKQSPLQNPVYQQPIIPLDKSWQEMNFEILYGPEANRLTTPVRPNWDYSLAKDELEEAEQQYFKDWLNETYKQTDNQNHLGYFEHNLEVWRQLWRVCEVSDVLVVVADIRNPILHLPPSFCRYVTERLDKSLVIALTKADLVSKRLHSAWSEYIGAHFKKTFVHFVSVYDDRVAEDRETETRRVKRYVRASGVIELVKSLAGFRQDMREQWDSVIAAIESRHSDDAQESSCEKSHPMVEKDLFTVGFIGQPNVGKSSLINSIFGRKVVSASKTPGHTKHFQTLHLSRSIRVCDSPGLIFPSFVERSLQIVTGLYNIAQVSDPYGPLLYLARRIDLPRALNLSLSEGTASVFGICEDYATKCGFLTSKTGRPDVYRAANLILRLVIDGKILIKWHPPGYIDVYEADASLTMHSHKHGHHDEHDEHDSSEPDSDMFVVTDQESTVSVEELNCMFTCGSFSVLASDNDDE